MIGATLTRFLLNWMRQCRSRHVADVESEIATRRMAVEAYEDALRQDAIRARGSRWIRP